jgi:hypothetical protein
VTFRLFLVPYVYLSMVFKLRFYFFKKCGRGSSYNDFFKNNNNLNLYPKDLNLNLVG